MKNILLWLSILALCAWVSRSDSADSVSADLVAYDWWEYTSNDLLSDCLVLPGQPPAEIELLLQQAQEWVPDPAVAATVNSRCWSLEILGRSGDQAAVASVGRFVNAPDWKVRAAAYLALARLGATEQAAVGLRDEKVVTLWADRREIAKGGRAALCQPVVLLTLKGLAETRHNDSTVDYLLQGLSIMPLTTVTYDSTPEPFPDLVSSVNPSWYQDAVTRELQRLGKEAIPGLNRQLELPDVSFQRVTGGGPHWPKVSPQDSVHNFCRGMLKAI